MRQEVFLTQGHTQHGLIPSGRLYFIVTLKIDTGDYTKDSVQWCSEFYLPEAYL